jgi:magnesium chelatase accessory protein
MSLDFQRDGADWPHRAASRFVVAGGLRFHVQVARSEAAGGAAVLLLHGLGAASHSWRGLLPLLARHATVIAPDLPGHGFSELPRPAASARTHPLSLPSMAASIAALLDTLGLAPALVVGHSAGAAIAARLVLDGRVAPRALVSLNGALLPFRGVAGAVFSPAARLLARLPLVPELVTALVGDNASVARMLRETGSAIDPEGLRLYARLVRDPGHVAGALGMMANWDLAALYRDLRRLRPAPLLLAGRGDRTVPPADARRLAALIPGAEAAFLPGLGHLMHEERPDLVAACILRLLDPAPSPCPAAQSAEASA